MVRDVMMFSSFDDFYIKKDVIKAMYSKIPRGDKMVYKYYLYSRRYIKERLCDIMWEFVNELDVESDEMKYYLSVMEKEYLKHNAKF